MPARGAARRRLRVLEVVDRVGLGLPHHDGVDDRVRRGSANLAHFAARELDQVGFAALPQPIARLAEVFAAVRRVRGVGAPSQATTT